ncbi:MAG: hypothetical protein ABIJ95_10060 [Pseudomonadota bacterium]
MEKVFVFAVCGRAQHTRTLSVALDLLSRYSRVPALVVTDPARNEEPVGHSRVVEVETPPEMDHARAAIWLKTSLHRILPPGPRYCYLDSDVLAVRPGVDRVFGAVRGPLAFAPDHCPISEFGPYAYDCGCLEAMRTRTGLLQRMLRAEDERLAPSPELAEAKRDLDALTQGLQFVLARRLSWAPGLLGSLLRGLYWRYFLKVLVRGRFVWDQETRTWKDASGHVLADEGRYHDLLEDVRQSLGFTFERDSFTWRDQEGRAVFEHRCSHFQEAARETFGVDIPDPDWVHANGGVFVFDHRASSFLDAWHDRTMAIFHEPRWAVRDQGTLAVTAWDFGWQHAPRLPVEYNFLADYHDPKVIHHGRLVFSTEGKRRIRPRFVHIYHEFGCRDWTVWQEIEKRLAG